MQNKRFLGLGFTFAAQDKGLEKKLVRIAALVDRINKGTGVKSIGSGAGVAAASIASGASGGSRIASARTSGGRVKGGSRKSSGSGGFSVSSVSDLHAMVAKYASAMGSLGYAFSKESEEYIKKSIKKGRKLDDISKSIVGNAEAFAQRYNVIKDRFETLKQVFTYISNWISNLGYSVEHFLGTLGVNLRDMIPKEFTAALGVVASLVAPIGHGIKAAGGKLLGMASQKGKDKVVDRVEKVTDAIGNSKSLPTVQKALSTLVDVEEKKQSGKDEGMFGKLKNMFGKIPFIGPILSGLIGGIGKVIGPMMSLGKWMFGLGKTLFSFGASAIKWLSSLENIIAFFENALVAAADFATSSIRFIFRMFRVGFKGFFEVLVPIIALAGAIVGFVSEIPNIWNAFTGFVGSLVDLGKALGSYLFTWLETSTGPIATFIKSVIVPAFEMLAKALGWIFDIFKTFGSSIGKLIGMTFDMGSILAQNATRSLNSATAQMKKDTSPSDRMRMAVDDSKNQEQMAKNSDDQLSESKKTNQLLAEFIQNQSSGKQIDLNIKSKPKFLEATVGRTNTLNAATAGGSGLGD